MKDYSWTEILLRKVCVEGKLDKEIAAELDIHVGTVKQHLTQIYQKQKLYGAGSRTKLVIWYWKQEVEKAYSKGKNDEKVAVRTRSILGSSSIRTKQNRQA